MLVRRLNKTGGSNWFFTCFRLGTLLEQVFGFGASAKDGQFVLKEAG